MDDFFFALLRISVAQILKAAGFDKCKPLVLNTITELYIKQFLMVAASASKFALARSNTVNSMDGNDILEALLYHGFLETAAKEDENTKSLDAFVQWLQFSDEYSVGKKLSQVPPSFLTNLMEKRKIDTSAETDLERKKRRLRERQEYFNQLKQGDDANSDAARADADLLDDDGLTDSDRLSWVAFLAEKDLKLGHNLKFVNTCLQNNLIAVHRNTKYHPTPQDGENSFDLFRKHIIGSTKSDHIVMQVQEADDKADEALLPSQELKDALPYNVKYPEAIVSDDLDQYVAYAEAHKEPADVEMEDPEMEEEGLEETVEEKVDVEQNSESIEREIDQLAEVGKILEPEELKENDLENSARDGEEGDEIEGDKDREVVEEKHGEITQDIEGEEMEKKGEEASDADILDEKDDEDDKGSKTEVAIEGKDEAQNEEEAEEDGQGQEQE